jgi:hypothetical protein
LLRAARAACEQFDREHVRRRVGALARWVERRC